VMLSLNPLSFQSNPKGIEDWSKGGRRGALSVAWSC